MTRIEAAALRKETADGFSFFICSASFEERCLTIAKTFGTFGNISAVVFYTSEDERTNASRRELSSLIGSSAPHIQLSTDSPIATADAISKVLKTLPALGDGKLLVDITCFTHEQLLILIRILRVETRAGNFGAGIFFAYSGAESYSHNELPECMWLSRGIREIRPVLGYSGRFSVEKPIQLILLVGFEHERAKAIIEFVEPGYLVLGRGKTNDSVSVQLAETNAGFLKKLEEFLGQLAAVFASYQTFAFSAVDSTATCNDILAVSDTENRNVIVCPMNTKISTVGAAMAAITDPRIQLMYVQPLEYNEAGYSKPGDHIRFGAMTI